MAKRRLARKNAIMILRPRTAFVLFIFASTFLWLARPSTGSLENDHRFHELHLQKLGYSAPSIDSQTTAMGNSGIDFFGDTQFASAEYPGAVPETSSFEIHYQVQQTINKGGGVRIYLGYPWFDTSLISLRTKILENFQISDPVKPNFSSAEVLNNDHFELYQDNQFSLSPTEFGFEVLPTSTQFPFNPGETIIFRLGDTRHGSPGYTLPKMSTEFWILVEERGNGNEPYQRIYPNSCFPKIETRPEFADRFKVIADSTGRPGQEIDIVIQARQNKDDFYSNSPIASTFIGEVLLTSQPAILDLPQVVQFTSADNGVVSLKVHPSELGVHRIQCQLPSNSNIHGESNPFLIRRTPPGDAADYRLLWGSLHVHTAVGGHAIGLPEDAFRYAREKQGLDFMASTEHCSMPDGNDFDWKKLKDLGLLESRQDEFVAFGGYEWTSTSAGHRNVVFKNSEDFTSVFCTSDGDTADELLMAMEGQDVIGIPHHTAWLATGPVDWGGGHSHPNQPLLEIYGWHGSSEYAGNSLPMHMERFWNHPAGSGVYAQEAIKAGYKMGFTGDGDNHLGLPGSNMAIPGRYSRMGLTGVYASEFTRDGIWNGLNQRRTVATTGARILGAFSVSGNWIGQEGISFGDPVISAKIFGTAPISSITVFRNGDNPVLKLTPNERDVEFSWVDLNTQAGHEYSYYLSVEQTDGHHAWYSPIWIKRGRTEDAF